MWGFKAAAQKRKQQQQQQQEGLTTKSIPGFSKWFANEMFIESKLIESSVEQMSLKMMENTEWVNSLMSDVLNGELNLNSSAEEDSEISNHSIHNDSNHESPLKKQTPEITIDDNKQLPTNRNVGEVSLLVLRSPTKLRNYEKSPLKQIHSKEIQLVRQDTDLLTANSPPHPNSNYLEPQIDHASPATATTTNSEHFTPIGHAISRIESSPATTTRGTTAVKEIERSLNSPKQQSKLLSLRYSQEDGDLSFEAISKNIRKSFAAKSMQVLVKESLDESEESDEVPSENAVIESSIVEPSESPKLELEDKDEQEEKAERLTPEMIPELQHKSTSTFSKQEKEEKERQEKNEINEISKLLDTGSDDISVSDFDDEISYKIGKLEKVELSQIRIPLKIDSDRTTRLPNINNSTTPTAPRSPIKFVELPSREPLTVKSTKKKSIRKSIRKSLHQHAIRTLDLNKSPIVNNRDHSERNFKPFKPKKSRINKLTSEPKDDPSPFKEDKTPTTKFRVTAEPFRLTLPDFSVTGNSVSEEPTIQLNRPIRKSRVHADGSPERSRANSIYHSPVVSSTTETDLVSRLMAPTKASARRSKTPVRYNKSPAKASTLKTPTRNLLTEKSIKKLDIFNSVKLMKEDIDLKEEDNRSPAKPKDLVAPAPIKLPSILEKSKILKPLVHANLGKRSKSSKDRKLEILKSVKLPLTEQSLKSSSTSSLLPTNTLSKPSGGSLLPKSNKFDKRKLQSDNLLQQPKKKAKTSSHSNSHHHGLREIPVNSSKLNEAKKPSNTKHKSAITKKLFSVQSATANSILPSTTENLPDIHSDNEETSTNPNQLAEWGSPRTINEQVTRQRAINPDSVFGPIAKIRVNEIFNKNYFSDLNLYFSNSDRLNQQDIDDYARQMEYR